MRILPLPSIRLRGVQYAPALALMEVLVAAAILAGVTLLFLRLLGEAHFDLARAERQSQAIALAQTLLQTAPSDWEHAATLGESQGMSWTRQCALWPFVRSPRLALLDCRVTIQRNNETPIALETAFAIPREALLRP